jgi:lipopolysaccharide export system permease protein
VTPTLSFYVARRFLGAFGLALSVVFGVVALVNMIELLRRTAETDASFATVLGMAAMQAPGVAMTLMPFTVMLAALAAFAGLARGSEITVARAAGVSAWALTGPAVLAAALLGGVAFAALNPVAAATTARYEILEERHVRGRTGRVTVSAEGLWLRQGRPIDDAADGPVVIHARSANGTATELSRVTLFLFDGRDGPAGRIDAARATLTPGAWLLRDGVRRRFDPDAGAVEDAPVPEPFAELRAPTELTPDQILDSFARPEAISFWALPGFIAALEASGFAADRHRLHWHAQLASPLLFGGMALLGAAFAMRPARLGGLGQRAMGAVLTAFGMFFVMDVARALGGSGAAPAALAAWAPAAAAALFAAGLLLQMEDG